MANNNSLTNMHGLKMAISIIQTSTVSSTHDKILISWYITYHITCYGAPHP